MKPPTHILIIATILYGALAQAAPLPTPERFPKLAEDIRTIGGKWPEPRWFEVYSNARIRDDIYNEKTNLTEPYYFFVNLHEEWEKDNADRYFPGLTQLSMPRPKDGTALDDWESWCTARFVMIHRRPSEDWFNNKREGVDHSLYNNQDIHTKLIYPEFFCEDMPAFRKEEKSEAIRAFLLRKIKLYAIILRDMREEFKPDYEKRFPGQMTMNNGVFLGSEEKRKAYRERVEKDMNEAAIDTIMRDRHFMLSHAIRCGEESLCVGLRQSFSGNAAAIRDILVCAGYKTPAQRADYWARMKKSDSFSQWSDADETRLMPEPEEPPTSTPAKDAK